MTLESDLSPEAEKSRVALTSVGAAVLLTGTKIVVGLMTGSLGILSEAAHSALDLVAAVVTVLAVKASARPADSDHPYGHGKVENLSALFETFLLLLTCAWIIKEAVARLLLHAVHVEANIWGFGVIALSIVVDLGRSRALMATAKKHHSQALEADALHFSTDVWSSSVVLLGLGLVFLSRKLQMPWLMRADAVAALAVAAIVVFVSVRLGRKTIAELLDAIPPDLVRQANARVLAVTGVKAVPRIRMRWIGGAWFSDVIIQVDTALTMEQAHAVADAVELSLAELMPGGDVVVHTEPSPNLQADGGGSTT
jgi:cation diffusion facilitator family transporter